MAKLPIPTIRDRTAYAFNRSTTTLAPFGLQGSAVSGSTGGTVANGTTYREVLCVAGHAAARVRLLTVTSTGTLTLTPIRPEVVTAGVPDESVYTGTGLIDPSKVVKYTTGGASKAVAAATECVVDLALSGENYVLVEFACTANGTITYCDAMSIDFAQIPASAGATASGAAASSVGQSSPALFNETTYDAQRGNTGVTGIGSGARTTLFNSGTLTNYNARGVIVVLSVTAASGTGGLTLTINGIDSTTGVAFPLLTGAANIITTGTFVYTVYPGVTVAANAAASMPLPRLWRLNVAVGDASSYTYSIGYQLIV